MECEALVTATNLPAKADAVGACCDVNGFVNETSHNCSHGVERGVMA